MLESLLLTQETQMLLTWAQTSSSGFQDLGSKDFPLCHSLCVNTSLQQVVGQR